MFKLDKNLCPPSAPAPVEVEARPYSLEHLAAWLETMPPKESYCYSNTGHCLIAQYFMHAGIAFQNIGGTMWYDANTIRHDLPDDLIEISRHHPRTFGGALSRAHNALAGEG